MRNGLTTTGMFVEHRWSLVVLMPCDPVVLLPIGVYKLADVGLAEADFG